MTTSLPDRVASLDVTCTPRVAFQGELGAYGDEAIAQRWGGEAVSAPMVTFDDVVDAVLAGDAARGVLPLWNSVVGEVRDGRGALARGAERGLQVIDEVEVAVRHQLLAVEGTSLDEVYVVASHPVALAQCRRFLSAHPLMMPHPVYDTAGAARELARARTCGHAAIASRAAAERYGLSVLAADIQDVAHNVTRFAVIARAGAATEGGRW